MKQLIMIKLTDRNNSEKIYEILNQTYQQMVEVIPGITSAIVERNYFERNERNFDFLITLEVSDFETIAEYGKHPIHRALIAEVADKFLAHGGITIR